MTKREDEMTDQLATTNVIESVVIDGDLSKLTAEQRVKYYQSVCSSLRINPLTRPFNYIVLNGKLTLYATKGAADQLRNIHNVSIDDITITEDTETITVMVKGHDETGRSDIEIGVVSKKDMQGNLGNAKMKAVTKAKRRLTLSLCGLGWLDETEIETIKEAKPINVDIETGEVEPPSESMPIEVANAMARKGSDDKTYGSCTDSQLGYKQKAIEKKMQGNLESSEQDELMGKLEDISIILDWRKQHPA
jgi:hypothetical protein